MVNFLIVASGFNCKGYDVKCIKSVQAQTYSNFFAVFISDGSTDGTLSKDSLKDINDGRLVVWMGLENQGAAKRRWDAIKRYAKTPDIVILLLGLDDELKPNALERIAKEYAAGKWMSYGNWINQHGTMLPNGFLDFDQVTHDNRDYRKVKYRSTAPNTFYRKLFDEIPEEDFKIDGKWMDSTTESHLMFCCLEMCGQNRIGVITDPIYLYNEALPNGTLRRLGTEYKYKIYNQVINRTKYPLYESIRRNVEGENGESPKTPQ